MKILITGGAGFIGSHLADDLLEGGFEVRILDSLVPQVHGNRHGPPDYLAKDAEFIRGDIRDPDIVGKAIKGTNAIFHCAASVGVGQSMYRVRHYSDINAIGTAVLLEALIHHPVDRLVVASSMSVYGEGLYRTKDNEPVENAFRSKLQLSKHLWDLYGEDEEPLIPVPTPETKIPGVPSVYALSKFYQERLCSDVAPAYGTSCVGLRFFNVYGPRQSLSNPYTGVLAILASRLLNNLPPIINEDGIQRRDFVFIDDIVQGCRKALLISEADGRVFNIGSGSSSTILNVAEKLAEVLNKKEIEPEITGKYRVGDIRNCFADISLAREILGYTPAYTLERGLEELAGWLATQQPAADRASLAVRELATRGLTV
jgi:dTDP-L-rhamnose 4-epimerase